MFGGTGDESESYSAVNPPFESSDIWNGWVLFTDFNGNIIRSDVFCHEEANTATEYGDLTENGYVIFNDTDAFGDTEVGVMKIVNPSLKNRSYNGLNLLDFFPNPTSSLLSLNSDKDYDIEVYDMLGNKLMVLTGNSINIEHLSTATYIVKAIDKSNNEELTYTVLKN